MSDPFSQGHAMIVGVGADLPNTVQDAEGIAKILADPERCAYPEKQVALLTQQSANREGILQAMDELAGRTRPDSTVVIYFSGHGYQVFSTMGASYYLMPYGYDVNTLFKTAISGDEFTQKLKAIPAQKLVVLLDCCHAGGVGEAKAPASVEFSKAPLPPQARELFSQGSGRVLIASSTGEELSYAGKPYSAFTLALVEAFSGVGVAKKDGYVRVTDLALHAREVVPQRTKNRQHPILHFESADNFVLAYYAGGESQPKGLPFEVEPEIEPEPGAWRSQFDQRGQTVSGPQTNIGGDVEGPVFSGSFGGGVQIGSIESGEGGEVNVAGRDMIRKETRNIDTSGGAYVGGNVSTGGGDFVGRDQKTYHTDIRDSQGIVIGDHNRVSIDQRRGSSPDELALAFARIRQEVAGLPSQQDREEAAHAVQILEDEARKGDQADEGRISRWLTFLAEIAPDAWEVAVDTFLNPVKGLSTAFQKIAKRARGG